MDPLQLQAMLRPISPTLANLIGSPGQALALAALGRTLLGDDQATLDQIGAALSGGGQDITLKVQQAEQELLQQITQSGTTLNEMTVQLTQTRLDTLARLDQQAATDRQRAREFQTKTNDSTSKWLAYSVTAAFFVVLMAVLIIPIVWSDKSGSDVSNNPVAQTLLGVLGTGWVSIISFYFGSSVGSKEKTALLGESVVPTSSDSSSGSSSDSSAK
jgi:hypothetical protein